MVLLLSVKWVWFCFDAFEFSVLYSFLQQKCYYFSSFICLFWMKIQNEWFFNNGIYNYRMNALPCDFSTLVSLNVDFSSKFLLFFQEASWLTIMFHNFLQANLCEGSGAICEMAGRSRRGGVSLRLMIFEFYTSSVFCISYLFLWVINSISSQILKTICVPVRWHNQINMVVIYYFNNHYHFALFFSSKCICGQHTSFSMHACALLFIFVPSFSLATCAI